MPQAAQNAAHANFSGRKKHHFERHFTFHPGIPRIHRIDRFGLEKYLDRRIYASFGWPCWPIPGIWSVLISETADVNARAGPATWNSSRVRAVPITESADGNCTASTGLGGRNSLVECPSTYCHFRGNWQL